MFVPRNLAKIVDKVARQTVGKDWNLYAALLERWPEIVGNDYAQVTTPVKMTFPHQPQEARQRGGTLIVRLPKGLAMEFTYKSEQIKQRINSYFGYDAVAKIAFQPVYGAKPDISAPVPEADPAALSHIKKTSQTIDNDELRIALEAFGEAVLKYSGEKHPIK
jgi:hypothetical protein